MPNFFAALFFFSSVTPRGTAAKTTAQVSLGERGRRRDVASSGYFMLGVERFEGNDALLIFMGSGWFWEDTDWGKQRGGNTEGAPKKDFGTIPYFFLLPTKQKSQIDHPRKKK